MSFRSQFTGKLLVVVIHTRLPVASVTRTITSGIRASVVSRSKFTSPSTNAGNLSAVRLAMPLCPTMNEMVRVALLPSMSNTV